MGKQAEGRLHVKRLLISFSGGETSALMTRILLLPAVRRQWDDVRIVFANTGAEDPRTLDFVQRVGEWLGEPVVWVEAAVQSGKGRGTRHTTVNHNSASRSGGPFEAVCAKYGIPNQKFPQCTREMKLRPITSYVRSIGWKAGTYDTAIGIRKDEADRVNSNYKELGFVYPFVFLRPTTKPEVNAFWARQPFRLGLKGYEGNCQTCWKKSKRKLFTIARDHPERFDLFRRLEEQYGEIGPEFDKSYTPGYRRTFFRGNTSTDELLVQAAAEKDFIPAEDDAIVFDTDWDSADGCSDACEIDWEEPEK